MTTFHAAPLVAFFSAIAGATAGRDRSVVVGIAAKRFGQRHAAGRTADGA